MNHARQRASQLYLTGDWKTEKDAIAFIEELRWSKGRRCPHCGDLDTVNASHKTMPYWCGACRKYFSVKTGTPMEGSNIETRKWLKAIHLMKIYSNQITSTQLGKELGISQQSAWYVMQRVKACDGEDLNNFFNINT